MPTDPPRSRVPQCLLPLLQTAATLALPSCRTYFGLIPGESQSSFSLILTKTAFSKVTKEEVVGQSPSLFDTNTVNLTMSSFS